MSGTAQISGDIDGGEGNDTISVSGGSILGSVYGDTFDFEFEGADDTISASGGTIAGSIFARDGADNVSVSGTAQIGVADGAAGSVLLEDGDDIFSMSGGTLAGAVIGGTGNDQIAVSGGRIMSSVFGDGDGRNPAMTRSAFQAGRLTARYSRMPATTYSP